MRPDRPIALTLTALLLWSSGSFAQQSVAPASDLKIVVVEGDGGKNNIRMRTAAPLVVKVVDAADKPVAGAEVMLQAPTTGPSGRFYEWLPTQTLRTDSEGMARAQAFTPNAQPGNWQLRVVAKHGAREATTVVSQTNVSPQGSSAANGKSRKGLWITLGVIGAAAIIGGAVAASGNGDTAATPSRPVVVAPGPITVGGPR